MSKSKDTKIKTTEKRKKGIDLFLSLCKIGILMRSLLVLSVIFLGLIAGTLFLIIISVLDRVLGWKILKILMISSALLPVLYFFLHYKFLNVRTEMFDQIHKEIKEETKKGADVEDVNK